MIDKFIIAFSTITERTQSHKKKLTHHRGTGVHHQDAIAVHDGVESMGDRQHRTLLELLPDRRLDQFVRSRIHIRGRLVQNEDRVVPDDSARQADQLPLTDAEIGAALVDVRLQAYLLQLDLLEGSPQRVVRVRVERVEIPSQAAGEQEWFLRDDADLGAQIVQADLARVDFVDLDQTVHIG